MSKERGLLERCLDEFQYHEVPVDDLIREIKEFLAQSEQEPVAWMVETNFNNEPIKEFHTVKPMDRVYKYCKVTELYTAPPEREPLSDEEIKMKWNRLPTTTKDPIIRFARAIEKAHGIGGEE